MTRRPSPTTSSVKVVDSTYTGASSVAAGVPNSPEVCTKPSTDASESARSHDAAAGPDTDNLFAWSLGGQASLAGFSAGFGFAKGEQGRGGT